MTAALGALLPVFMVIALGWGLRRARFPGEGFWAPVERITYYLFFPALLIHTLQGVNLGGVLGSGLVPALLIAVSLMGLAVAVLSLGLEGPAATSMFQGAIRFNTYVFLATVASLFGPAGLALGAVCVAFVVPVINVYCVSFLARRGHGRGRAGWLAEIVRNPLIIACVAGLLLSGSAVHLPSALAKLLEILGRAALPLGLLAVGAALDPARARAQGGIVVLTTAAKLILLPLVGYAACSLLGVGGLARAVGVLWCAMPTATSSYILARQLGGDAPLMAGMVSTTHLGAFVTLPLVVWLLPL